MSGGEGTNTEHARLTRQTFFDAAYCALLSAPDALCDIMTLRHTTYTMHQWMRDLLLCCVKTSITQKSKCDVIYGTVNSVRSTAPLLTAPLSAVVDIT